MRSVHTKGSTHGHLAWISPACFSPHGHCRRFCFPTSVRHASTFLPPFTPRPLQALHRYYEGSDSCPALLRRTGLPASRARPSDHSISNHLTCLHRSFVTLLSSVDPPLSRVQTSPITSRLAGHVRPNRVRHPTDWSFTSRCFPPRLTATQFRSVKGLSVCLKGTCTPLTTHACRRTGAAVPAAHARGTRAPQDSRQPCGGLKPQGLRSALWCGRPGCMYAGRVHHKIPVGLVVG